VFTADVWAESAAQPLAGGAQIPDFDVLEVNAPWRLKFRWRLGGVDTLVEYDLESYLELTDLTVTQSAERSPAWADSATEPNWWWLALAALRSYLEEGRPDLRLDYHELRSRRELRFEAAATTFPWVLWSKLTIPGELRRWWAASPRLELEAGGAFCFEGEPQGPSEVLEVDEGKRLAHDWDWPDGSKSRIEWRITETEGDTLVSVEDDAPPADARERTRRAIYWASALLHLIQMSEKGITPREYQSSWTAPLGVPRT
jgi:uncharacterized protein YndB with AHSA1/START domain